MYNFAHLPISSSQEEFNKLYIIKVIFCNSSTALWSSDPWRGMIELCVQMSRHGLICWKLWHLWLLQIHYTTNEEYIDDFDDLPEGEGGEGITIDIGPKRKDPLQHPGLEKIEEGEPV